MASNKKNTRSEFHADWQIFMQNLTQEFSDYFEFPALGAIANANAKGGENWECPTSTIIFKKIDLGQKAMPKSAYRGEGKVKLIVKGQGIAYESDTICNPLETMSVQIIIEVARKKKGNEKVLKASWHMDKQSDLKKAQTANLQNNNNLSEYQRTVVASEQESEDEFHHSEYHLHFGGKELTEDANINSNILLLGSPRIQYYPMDIILAIDFVIKNFYAIEKRKKLEKTQYTRVVEKAKERLWKPYIYAMAQKYDTNRFGDLTIDTTFTDQISGIF
jgi:hypothetical protein